jgi:transglutaminase-like putative cysteine protease
VIYRVVHKTIYHYGELVPLCHNVIHLQPRDTPTQVCQHCELSIDPLPAVRRDLLDYFGNHMTWVSLQEPHEVLKIEAKSEVAVSAHEPPPPTSGPTWERAVEMIDHDLSLYLVKEYAFDSPQVAADPALADYARPSFGPGRSLLACVAELNERIHREFIFDSTATTVGTPVLEVLAHRRGVCQDFAHLGIGCLRSLGLAARYVSGYVLTHPPPGKERLAGADASHAWISVYVPEIGWVDFDPTNGVFPSGEHVTIGWARDYDEVSPLKGVIMGGHHQAMYFGVDVEPLVPIETPAAADGHGVAAVEGNGDSPQ